MNIFNHKNYLDINRQEITSFLNSKIKPVEADLEKKWITTWNHYYNHLKFFYRWLYNEYNKTDNDTIDQKSIQDWITPEFIKLKLKKTKRLSPDSQNEIWEKEELFDIEGVGEYDIPTTIDKRKKDIIKE